jgi:hypothetical protein
MNARAIDRLKGRHTRRNRSMKKTLGIIAASAFAIAAFSAPVAAAPADAACFGQVHKTINTVGALGFTNVGDVVQAIGGQGKNAVARGICAK